MRSLLKFFLRGLVVITPIVVTVWICVKIFETIDGWLGFRYRGVGFVATIVLITAFGFIASSFVTRGLIAMLEDVLERLPFVRLLYTSTKDMLNAFVGEKRRFDKPVLVTLSADGTVKTIGFLTADSLSALGVTDHVTVYVPQSYGFAGNIIVVPATHVRRIDADAADVMAYIISGGVTEVETRRHAPTSS
jgi:uncharacterized membrane protein